jgi:transketolase
MWEAAMFAGHRGLGNLTVVVDRNRLQQGARTEETNSLEPLAEKWRAFGWEVAGVDGHDHAALLEAFDAACRPRSKPLCIIADTIKGKGVSFMEDKAGWHHGVPNPEQYAQAIAELNAAAAR